MNYCIWRYCPSGVVHEAKYIAFLRIFSASSTSKLYNFLTVQECLCLNHCMCFVTVVKFTVLLPAIRSMVGH